MILSSSIFLVVAAFALTIPGTGGQERLLSQEDAFGIARTVNTAEVEFFALSRHAVDLQSLHSHRFIQISNPSWSSTGAPIQIHFPPKATMFAWR